MQNHQWDLNTPLLEFKSKTGTTHWTIEDSFTSVSIMGSSGSGKTTSSFSAISLKFLAAGYGGLILTTKPTDMAAWVNLCKKTNREKDLLSIKPGGHRFNFLEYLSKSSDGETSYSQNVVQVLKTILNADKAGGTSSEDPFWEGLLETLMHSVITLSLLAHNKVTVDLMYEIVISLPKKESAISDLEKTPFLNAFKLAKGKVDSAEEKFKKLYSPNDKKRFPTPDHYQEALLEHVPALAELRHLDQFFFEYYKNLSERTRSVANISFLNFLGQLMREPIYSIFSKGTSTVTPNEVFDGKLILIDLPTKTYFKAGLSCQNLFKYIFELVMEKRNVEIHPRPVFIAGDEMQQFITEHSADFLATARSSRIATLGATQNLHSYYSKMGGMRSEHRVKSLLGNIGLKIFHNNNDLETNRYASDLIGEAYVEDNSASTTMGGKFSYTRNKSFKLEKMVRPEEFQNLKTGGQTFNFQCEAYAILHNKTFDDGFHHRKISVDQIL